MSSVSDPDLARDDMQAALDRSACLGVWSQDFTSDRFFASPGLATVFGVGIGALAAGISASRMLRAVHPEDRVRVESIMYASGEAAEPFEVEFRVMTTSGGLRWVRLMGRSGAEPPDGAIRTRGLAFDLTEGRNPAGPPARQAQCRANQLADHATAMTGLVASLQNPPLSELVQKVAVEVGFEVARRIHQVHGERPH